MTAVISTAVLSMIQGVSRHDIIQRRYLDLFIKDKKMQHAWRQILARAE